MINLPKAVRKYVYYEEKTQVILCGDCLEILPLLEPKSVDFVLTDPPYGFNRFETDRENYIDNLRISVIQWPRLLKDSGHAFVFTSTRCILEVGALIPLYFRRALWLYKPSDCTYPYEGWLLTSEAILWFSNQPKSHLMERRPYRHDCYIHTKVGHEGVNGHPTVKPLFVIKDLINRSNETALILDPFLGSGTTLVACKNLGRRGIGIEIEEKYCKIAVERLKQEIFSY